LSWFILANKQTKAVCEFGGRRTWPFLFAKRQRSGLSFTGVFRLKSHKHVADEALASYEIAEAFLFALQR
jgi:hypothetical protein